jgi:DNA-binding NtrC family response regulator
VRALRSHTFPGNVRELRNLLERSLLRTDPDALQLAMDLVWLKGRSETLRPGVAPPGPVPVAPAPRQLNPLEEQEYQLIAKTLIQEKGGIRRSAAKLGVTPQTLLRRLQKWPELRQKAPPEPGGGTRHSAD